MAIGLLKMKLVAEVWNFVKNLRIARAAISIFAKVGTAGLDILTTKLGKLGVVAGITFAILAGGMLLFAKQLRPAIELQEKMANISTLMRDKVGAAFSHVNKWITTFTANVINLSAEFGETSTATAKGLYDILSATIPVNDAIKVLTVSMRAARAGLTSTATATKAIVNVLMAYNMAFDQAAKISDIFFATIRRGITTFGELTPVVGRAAATAAVAGVSFEELMASVAAMTRSGLDTGVTITSINQTLLQFFKPTEDAIRVAAKLGLNLDLTTLKTEGLLSVMEKLSDILPEQVGQMFRQMRALRGVNALIQQITGFTEDYNLMLDSAGETQAAFEKQAQSVTLSLDRVKQGFNALRIQAMMPFLPLVKKASDGLSSFMGVLRKITPGVAQVTGSVLMLAVTVSGLVAAGSLLTAVLTTVGISITALLSTMALVAASVAVTVIGVMALVKGLTFLEKRFGIVSKIADLFFRTFSFGILNLEKVKIAISKFGDKLSWLGHKLGLLKEDWSEVAAAEELASALKRLTEEIDKSVIPTDQLRDRWESVVEALKQGAPLTADVKQGLDDLAGQLHTSGIYTGEVKEGLIALVDAVREVGKVTPGTVDRIDKLNKKMSKGKLHNEEYTKEWIKTLRAIAEGDTLTEKYRTTLSGLYTDLANSNFSSKMKSDLSEIAQELFNTAEAGDAVRKKMKEIQDAFNKARATTARLKASFSILGEEMPQHLNDIAIEADWAFNTILRDGAYSATQLEDVWLNGFIPKLLDAFEDIPERYRTLTLQMTGYTLEMIQALSTLDVDTPTRMQAEARKAAGALLMLIQENEKLDESQRVSAEIITEQWEKVVEQIEKAFGTVPVEFNALAKTITGVTTGILNDLRMIEQEPFDILRNRADAMVKAFLELREQTSMIIGEDQLSAMWVEVSKAVEDAYGTFPEDLIDKVKQLQDLQSSAMVSRPELVADVRSQFQQLGKEIEAQLEKLPPKAQEMWKKIILIPEVLKQDGEAEWKDFINRIQEGMTIEEWAIYKRLQPLIKGWERTFDTIKNMEDVAAQDRTDAMQKLLTEIEAAGGKYTAIWRRVYNALNLLNESQVRTFKEIVNDVGVEIRRELSNSIEENLLHWGAASAKSMDLIRMEMEERKRTLKDSLTEGKISHERYYAELSELDRQFTEESKSRMSGFQKFYIDLWGSIKKFWVKLLAEMLAEWMMNQLKMIAMSIKRATTEIAAESAVSKTKAVKSASGIPFPLNIAAIAVAVGAVTALLANVSKFATGGIVTKPMLGLVGEAGPEAIIPLGSNRASQMFDRSSKDIRLNFQDHFTFTGPTMVEDQQAWDSMYRDKVLPAKKRHMEELRDISGQVIE